MNNKIKRVLKLLIPVLSCFESGKKHREGRRAQDAFLLVASRQVSLCRRKKAGIYEEIP